jgi:hypothetical protein
VIVNNVNNMSDEEIKARLKKLMGEKWHQKNAT